MYLDPVITVEEPNNGARGRIRICSVTPEIAPSAPALVPHETKENSNIHTPNYGRSLCGHHIHICYNGTRHVK